VCIDCVGTIKRIGYYVSAATYTHSFSRIIGNGHLCTVRVGTIKRIGKHVSAASYTHSTIEEMSETVTTVRFVWGK
jgi:hypothetical protein